MQTICDSTQVEKYKDIAWNAENAGDQNGARKNLIKACDCDDIEACVNAIRFETDKSASSQLLIKACNLGHGNSCFLAAEEQSGDNAKIYYEKGCELNDPISCRQAGTLSDDNQKAALEFFEKGCNLGDGSSCVNAYQLSNDPAKQTMFQRKACEFGFTEHCKK